MAWVSEASLTHYIGSKLAKWPIIGAIVTPEAWIHPYHLLSDGNLSFQREPMPLQTTFVRMVVVDNLDKFELLIFIWAFTVHTDSVLLNSVRVAIKMLIWIGVRN